MSTSVIPTWTLADRLIKARRIARLDQAELASRLGVSLKTLQRYEQSANQPKRGVVLGWAIACGVSAPWLLTGEEPAEGDTDAMVANAVIRGYPAAA